jgi:hypothetical protein
MGIKKGLLVCEIVGNGFIIKIVELSDTFLATFGVILGKVMTLADERPTILESDVPVVTIADVTAELHVVVLSRADMLAVYFVSGYKGTVLYGATVFTIAVAVLADNGAAPEYLIALSG